MRPFFVWALGIHDLEVLNQSQCALRCTLVLENGVKKKNEDGEYFFSPKCLRIELFSDEFDLYTMSDVSFVLNFSSVRILFRINTTTVHL